MSNGNRGISNNRLRRLIDKYLQGCMPGTRVSAYDLMHQLTDRRRSLTAHRVSLFLRERPDLQHTGMNEWVVVR